MLQVQPLPAAEQRQASDSARYRQLSHAPAAVYLSYMMYRDFDRITAEPGKLEGKPCVRGMRLSVQRVLEILADNPSWDDLRADYPELDAEDVRQVLAFAAASLGNERLVPVDDSAA